MKVLQLCLRVPFPPRDGATIAMYNLSDSLIKAGAVVKALSFNTKKSLKPNFELKSEIVNQNTSEVTPKIQRNEPADVIKIQPPQIKQQFSFTASKKYEVSKNKEVQFEDDYKKENNSDIIEFSPNTFSIVK